MVRAGVVSHPSHYPYCGYNEIVHLPKLYKLIENERSVKYCGFTKRRTILEEYKRWIDTACRNNSSKKEKKWSETIAIGTHDFIEEICNKHGSRADSREIMEEDGIFHLQEPTVSYNSAYTNNDIESWENTLY